MKKLLLITLIILFPLTSAIAQYASIWDQFPDELKNTNAFQRYKWQYQQIAYPFDTIPMHTYAMELKKEVNRINLKLRKTDSEVEWSPIGPTGVESLRLINPNWGISSGRVRAVAVDPTDPSILYIAAASGGIWKTTDGGESWEDIGSNESKMLTFGALCIDPNNPNIIYAGTGEICALPQMRHYGKGLFKSTDGGLNWIEPTDTFGTITEFGDLVVSPHNSDVVYAALGSGYILLNQNQLNEGIWKSIDGGTNWARTLDVQDAYDIIIHPASPDTIYAAAGGKFTTSGFYISVDAGVTWEHIINTGLPNPTTIGRMQIDIAKSSPNILYAVIYDGMNNTPKAYKTTNSGSSWSQISAGTQLGGNYGSGWQDVGWYALFISVDPNNPDHVFIGNIELHETTNGADFTVRRLGGNNANYSVVHVDYHSLVYAPSDPDLLFIGCDGGIYKSTDNGVTYSDLNNGISTIQFYRIASHPVNENIMIGGAQDNGTSVTFELTTMNPWAAIDDYDGMDCFFDFDYPDSVVYASSQYGRLIKSTDGGNSFFSIANMNGWWITPFIMHPTDHLTLYSANNKIYRTSDGGSTFSIISGTDPVVQTMVVSMAQNKVSPNIMILTGGGGTVPLPSNSEVKVSADTGVTWIDVTANIPGESKFIIKVHTHPSDPNTMYIVKSGLSDNNKIYMTTDLGNTWTNISGDLPNLPCWDLFVDPNNPNHLYAGMDVGVYRTTNGGINWQYISENIPLLPVWDFNYVEYGNYAKLKVGTYGRSAYETEWSLLQLPSVPILALPQDSSSFSDSTDILFVWQQSLPEVGRYWFELDTTEQFSTSYIDSTITDTTYLYSSLQIDKRYWWRVKAGNAAGWGSFSEVRTFDTYVTSVEIEETILEFALGQNYPNPFNPGTKLKYSVPKKSLVQIKVFGVLGNEIEILVNEEKPAGTYELTWNAADLPSGVYFYQLKAGDFIQTKKMILLK